MADRPILFSAPMVLALLAGRKTQTRRLAWRFREVVGDDDAEGLVKLTSPWRKVQPGDRLWVRENFFLDRRLDGKSAGAAEFAGCGLAYEATEQDGQGLGRLRPSIHMPRQYSRLTLTVTDVRVQRLQEISEEDASAEGAREAYGEPFDASSAVTDRRRFQLLWNRLHGPGAWGANPEVVALTFTVKQGNIDA